MELDLDAAGLASRFLAALFDVVCMMVVLYALFTVVGLASVATAREESATLAVVGAIGVFGVLLVWPTVWEVATKGRSLGKLVFGLRVVTTAGAPIRVRHALVRGLVGLVEIVMTFGLVAVAVALGSRRFQRLGDHLAGTVVVRERGAGADRAQPRRFIPYPGWEAWTARLDTTRLTADDYRLVRSFLLRSYGLPVEARTRLGLQILERVLPRTGHDRAVLSTLGAWSVEAPLTAVAAAYQRRFDGITV